MAVITHTSGYFAAAGGPPSVGPDLSKIFGVPIGDIVSDDTSAAVAVMWIPPGTWGVVNCITGEVYAEATNPSELGPWMAEYLAQLGREVEEYTS